MTTLTNLRFQCDSKKCTSQVGFNTGDKVTLDFGSAASKDARGSLLNLCNRYGTGSVKSTDPNKFSCNINLKGKVDAKDPGVQGVYDAFKADNGILRGENFGKYFGQILNSSMSSGSAPPVSGASTLPVPTTAPNATDTFNVSTPVGDVKLSPKGVDFVPKGVNFIPKM